MKLKDCYAALSPVLRPLGMPYAKVMQWRRQLYATGRLAVAAPVCPCVSVGNIAFGGTGKTPLVSWLLEEARRAGRKAVVLSRGYRAKPGPEPLLVRCDTPVEKAGDEPLMLARQHPEAAVLVHPKRALSARYAAEHLAPDLMILDDGMQHLAVKRDLDLVLLRPDDLEGDWNRVIPSGPWREGVTALNAASAFLIKAGPEEFARLEPQLRRRVQGYERPVFSFELEPVGLRPLFSAGGGPGEDAPGEEEPGHQEPGGGATGCVAAGETPFDGAYALLSGVGNPAGVEASATRFMGRPPLQHFDFPDHHAYTGTEVQAVLKMLPVPLPVLTTAKDAVKLAAFAPLFANSPAYVLHSRAVFGPALFCSQDFPAWWRAWLGKP